MSERLERIRIVIGKLSEAIWNLDQLEPLEPEIKEQYERIHLARQNLVEIIREKR